MSEVQERLQTTYAELGKVIRPTAWTTPLELPRIRQDLLDGARSGRPPQEPWSFPVAELEVAKSAIEACEVALADVEREGSLHPQELWAYRTVLEDARRDLVRSQVRDGDLVTQHSVAIHGAPTAEDVAAATRILAQPEPAPQPRNIAATAVREVMARALECLGIADWEVVLDENMAADMSVVGGKHLVKVRADARFAPDALDQLLVHEIGTHVLRRHRAEQQPCHAARLTPGPAIRTEEGFAVCRESQAGVDFPQRKRTYAARVVAVDVAVRHGIGEVIDAIAPAVGVESAVNIAIRVKRGITQPNLPGANVKDHVYFTGSRMVATHLAAHPDDLGLLFATKWPLEELWRVRELATAGLINPVDPDVTAPRAVLNAVKEQS